MTDWIKENELEQLKKRIEILEDGEGLLINMIERMNRATNEKVDGKIRREVKKVILTTISNCIGEMYDE